MTIATFTPPERWPFLAGQAVWHLPSGHSWNYPMPLIPAIVLSCHTLRGCPLGSSKASIVRADKLRPSNVSASRLVYRGFCQACEVPAIEGTHSTLICPACGQLAVALPPPDQLIVRWFPLNEWLESRVMRRQIEHPTWSWRAAREAADTPYEEAYEGMLRRLKLPRLYNSVDFSSDTYEERRLTDRQLGTLQAAALLGDDALFLSTHQELSARQVQRSQARAIARRLQSISQAELARIADVLMLDDDEPPTRPPTVTLIPLPERPDGDDAPGGADELTGWLEQQFRKKTA